VRDKLKKNYIIVLGTVLTLIAVSLVIFNAPAEAG
jgi:hypothetical protein